MGQEWYEHMESCPSLCDFFLKKKIIYVLQTPSLAFSSLFGDF